MNPADITVSVAAHDDPAFAAKRKLFADLPFLPAESGFRTKLLERDADRLERTRRMLCEALEDLLREHAALRGNDDRAVVAARRALTLGRLAA